MNKVLQMAKFSSFYTTTLQLQPFYGSLDFVRDNLGEPVPEGTFCHLRDFLVQNEDNTGRCNNNCILYLN